MPIEDEKLIEYVLGLSDGTERRVIEAELTTSKQLRKRIARLHDTLVIPALAADPVEPDAQLGTRIQESITSPSRFHGFIDRLTVFLDLPDKRVRELLDGIEDAAHDLPESELPGVWVKEFEGGVKLSGSQCALMWIDPGAVFPRHQHVGDEWGFVLQGEAEEDSGKVYKPGDIVHQPPGSIHFFTARTHEPFVFFVVYDSISFR